MSDLRRAVFQRLARDRLRLLAAAAAASFGQTAGEPLACGGAAGLLESSPERCLLQSSSWGRLAQSNLAHGVEDEEEEEEHAAVEFADVESGSFMPLDLAAQLAGSEYEEVHWQPDELLNESAAASVPTVELALFLNNVDMVSTRTSTWTGDVVIHSRFRKADFQNHNVSVELLDGYVDYRSEVRQWEDDGNVTKMEHVFVSMSYRGDYDLFPFDSQFLTISVQLKGLSLQEARFAEWPNESGVRPRDNITGRHFHTQQFWLRDWDFIVTPFKEPGFPYWKSRAQLHVLLGRFKASYLLTCIFIPAFAICFALFAFFLPSSFIVSRVSMSFTSFLAIFVHLKEMSGFLPDGVWCWLLTDMVFYVTVLCALVGANISSARTQKDNAEIAKRIDGLARVLLPIEFMLGQVLLLTLQNHHRVVGLTVVFTVLVTHVVGFAYIFAHTEPPADGARLSASVASIASMASQPRDSNASSPRAERTVASSTKAAASLQHGEPRVGRIKGKRYSTSEEESADTAGGAAVSGGGGQGGGGGGAGASGGSGGASGAGSGGGGHGDTDEGGHGDHGDLDAGAGLGGGHDAGF